jgi:AcrR family transcriptional regulator
VARQSASKRRMGPESAATRFVLMDATEMVMREEGYAAVTSRRVAERAGVNQQTVYYYFETMDDLLLATYRRRTKTVEERFEAAASSSRPLQAFADVANDPDDAVLTMEYLALSNHNEIIRTETIAFGERFRREYVQKLAAQYSAVSPAAGRVPPFGIFMGLTYIAHLKGFEKAIGLSGGHRETDMLVDWLEAQFTHSDGTDDVPLAPHSKPGAGELGGEPGAEAACVQGVAGN